MLGISSQINNKFVMPIHTALLILSIIFEPQTEFVRHLLSKIIIPNENNRGQNHQMLNDLILESQKSIFTTL